ncbi:hypothetical protein Salat_0223200 [Sesamum alatum]|uniref:Uncharacterized protein n=1 Tax=Sesamum alatum TaxID=300844 RepID=A0AAE1Z044_9LAMI|nr:hypothetical protein Salat_0223200 [Sesamum alatum]
MAPAAALIAAPPTSFLEALIGSHHSMAPPSLTPHGTRPDIGIPAFSHLLVGPLDSIVSFNQFPPSMVTPTPLEMVHLYPSPWAGDIPRSVLAFIRISVLNRLSSRPDMRNAIAVHNSF